MIEGKRILAVVPARGGSKGVKLKNLRQLNGVSLVTLTGRIISQLEMIDQAIVSTDHPDIVRAAEKSGLKVPFVRPDKLSGDLISDVEVLTHALEFVEAADKRQYDYILMLQPTSPFRKPEHVKAVMDKILSGNYDSVLTVSQTEARAHPLKQLILENDKISYYDLNGAGIIARQQLKPLYQRNGAAYAMTRSCLLDQKTTIGKFASAVVIKEIMINIDTEFDLKLAEFILSHETH